MPNVITIPASRTLFTQANIAEIRKRKVAAYARVSTDSEEQQTSYEAQVDYYQTLIQNREDWDFVSVYTDAGISGTSIKHRGGFNSMIQDALAGNIDLIVTKSVSRFARNTVDSLTTIRQLKAKGIECYFEKENIWTFDGKGELLITIMSSLAQEESRSISENVKWGHRKRFADGKVTVPFKRFLGYDKGENGNLVINEEEAVIIRMIYRNFLEGLTPHKIASILTAKGILSPGGKEKWNPNAVRSILSNEKYKGDALLQKSYTVDFLTKKQKKNDGEIPQYYVEKNHEPIISTEVFEMVQKELGSRLHGKGRYSGVDIFASKLRCDECGSFYGPKVWHSTSKYRKVIYQCNRKFKDGVKCNTPHFTEEQIKVFFVEAVNKLLVNKDEIIANITLVQQTLFDTSTFEQEKMKLHDDLPRLTERIENLVHENAKQVQNQDEYQKGYNALVKQYDEAKAEYEKVENQIADRLVRKETMEHFIRVLKRQDGMITAFDSALWGSLLDSITVYGEKDVCVRFKDGSEI